MSVLGLVLEYIGAALCFIGALFFILGGVGLVRMPDVFNRMQASTKTTTLGLMSIIIGVAFMEPLWLPKAIVMFLFVFITAPVGASALARAAYRSGAPLWKGTVINACRGVSGCVREVRK